MRRKRWEIVALVGSLCVHGAALGLIEANWADVERQLESSGDASRIEAPPAILVDVTSLPTSESSNASDFVEEVEETEEAEVPPEVPEEVSEPVDQPVDELVDAVDEAETVEPTEAEEASRALDIPAPVAEDGIDPVGVEPDETETDKPDVVPTPKLRVAPPAPKPVEPEAPRESAESAAAAGGSGGRGSSVGRGGDLAASYRAEVAARLAAKRFYPNRARRDRASGTVVIAFVIDRQGRASGIRIVTSSGSVHLDEAAKSIVTRSSPFPPLPPALGAQLPVRVPLRFDLPR